jgi:hypothetical protein
MPSAQGEKFAVSIVVHSNLSRYAPHPNGYDAAVRLSQDYILRARSEIDFDNLSIDALQALLLLSSAFYAAGKGKSAYMMLSMKSLINKND